MNEEIDLRHRRVGGTTVEDVNLEQDRYTHSPDNSDADDGEDVRLDPSRVLFGRTGPPPLRSRKRLPLKTALAAFVLAFIGITFSISGLVVFYRNSLYDSIPFFTIGAIGFIPGVYNSIILLRAYLGHPGFDYSMVPSYDD